jgi:hypothetical protein
MTNWSKVELIQLYKKEKSIKGKYVKIEDNELFEWCHEKIIKNGNKN